MAASTPRATAVPGGGAEPWEVTMLQLQPWGPGLGYAGIMQPHFPYFKKNSKMLLCCWSQ